jgi:Outer membrane lipoprotein carrier protein LolA-like
MGQPRLPERRRALRAAAAVLLVALGVPVGAAGIAQAAPPSLDDLLKRTAVTKADEVPFEEKKYVGAVTEPLISRGVLRFEPPDKLIKKTETPVPETAIVDKDSLRILNGEGVETANIGLWVDPDLQLVFDSLRAVLRGDANALRDLFDTTLAGDAKDWTLTLVLKQPATASRVTQIVVTGDAQRLRGFDIYETGGDRSFTRLLDAPQKPR